MSIRSLCILEQGMTERSRTDKTRQDSNTVCECVDSDNCSTAERKKENETNNERRERMLWFHNIIHLLLHSYSCFCSCLMLMYEKESAVSYASPRHTGCVASPFMHASFAGTNRSFFVLILVCLSIWSVF